MVLHSMHMGRRIALVLCLVPGAIWADDKAVQPPPLVGVPEAEANLRIWFVDHPLVVATWRARDAYRHTGLVKMFSEAGLKPRIEHMAQADFFGRWNEAEELHQLPDLLVATRGDGAFRILEQEGRCKAVVSQRLSYLTEYASCEDFADRALWLVRSPDLPSSRGKALELLMRPGREFELSGPHLGDDAGRLEAEQTARRAVTAFLCGDSSELKAVASRRSSQLAECTRPGSTIKETKAQVREVQLRGNGLLAIAIVESSFESDRFVGADPVVVVLLREDKHWKALCVCQEITTLEGAVPVLCKAIEHLETARPSPPEPRLEEPGDGQVLSAKLPFLTWTVPGEGGPLLAQVFEHHFGDLAEADARWPQARLRVFPAEPRGGKVNPFLGGFFGSRMSWTIWTIGSGV
jgi:hypothetical protein